MVDPAINTFKSYEQQTRLLQNTFESVVKANEYTVEAMKSGMAKDYARLLRDLKSIVADAHEKYAKAGKLNYQELARYNRIRDLESQIDKAIANNYGPIRKQIIKDQRGLVENTHSVVASGINAATGATLPTNISGKGISNILSKPWSGISMDERMFLRQKYLGVQVKGQIMRDVMGEGATYKETASGLEKIITKDYAGLGKETESNAHQFQSDTEQEVLDAAGEENIELTKTWVTAGDDRVRDAHELLDGQTVNVNEMFEIPKGDYAGFQAEGPGLFGVPELDINCRCYVVANVRLKEERTPLYIPDKYEKEFTTDFFKAHKNKKTEWLRAYKDGKMVAENTDRDKMKVSWIRGDMTDMDMIHNHPTPAGSPALSKADLYVAVESNVNSITAITRDGQYWTVYRPKDGWDTTVLNRNNILSVYEKTTSDAFNSPRRDEILSLKRAGELTADEATQIFTRYIVRTALKELGVKFKIDRVGGY